MNLLQNLNPHNRRVLIRTEFDVPVAAGKVVDSARILDSAASIKYLLTRGAKVVVISHRGRPEGYDPNFSLKPCASELSRILGTKVSFCEKVIGDEVVGAVGKVSKGEVLLLENLRFEKAESEKNDRFAQFLASLGEVYVNEAFGVCHRDHTSISLLPTLVTNYVGVRLNLEIQNLSKALHEVKRPFVFIFGGKKADTKIELLPEISRLADKVLLGGTMFLESDIGKNSEKIVRPLDVVLGKKSGKTWETKTVDFPVEKSEPGWVVYDVGPKTVRAFSEILAGAKTIVWNGPLGFFEQKQFAEATTEIAQRLALSRGFVIAGGGDTIAALDSFKLKGRFDFVSSGGGAMLEFLAGRKLPGLVALGYYS